MGKTSIRKVKKNRNKRHSRRIINLKAYLEIVKDSNLIRHAIKELKLAGYYKPDEYGMNTLMKDQILELLAVFTSHGHSGHSAPFAIKLFSKLANWEIISDLTLADDEFVDCGWRDEIQYQNIRDHRIFKDEKGISFSEAFSKTAVKVKRYGSDKVEDCNSGGWYGSLFESENGIATGRMFRTCYFTKKDVESKRLPIGRTIHVKCTEIEVQKDDWLMFVDITEPTYTELKDIYDIDYINVDSIKGKNIYELTHNYGH